jgi:CBS domain containing-hemolysin-like protein
MPPPSDGLPIAIALVIVVALVLANAFFVAAEFALVGARKTRLEAIAEAGDGKARLALKALQSLRRYISATQLGITLASLGLGWVGEPALAHLFEKWFVGLRPPFAAIGTHGMAVALGFTIITTLHIVLGELVPKATALLYPETVSRWFIVPLAAFAWVMYYPTTVLNGSASALLRLFGITAPSEADRLHSPDEIRMLVEQSGEAGSIEREDARLIEGVFEFSEKSAEEVMTPRTDVKALAADLTVDAAADVVAQAGRSRYPVYVTSFDEIVGVVHAKDILRALRQAPGTTVRQIMREPLFVPGTREVEDVLADMKRLKTHLAVVLDEYGGTAGLVTMEDLLEEIVGEIYDEHDLVRNPVRPAGDGTPVLDGAMPLAEFNNRFDADLDDAEYTTLGGFLFGQLGRLPKVGDRVTVGERTFVIAVMKGKRVMAVKVEQGRDERRETRDEGPLQS